MPVSMLNIYTTNIHYFLHGRSGLLSDVYLVFLVIKPSLIKTYIYFVTV